MRLIDADALKEKFINSDANGIALAIDRYALKCIDDAPSIDIVRCKECKHWHEFIDAKGQGRCDADAHKPFRVSIGVSYADFFCSYGERKESDR